MRILLAGATGLVGSLVAERLRLRRDVELASIVRTPRSAGDIRVDFERLVADPGGVLATLDPGHFDVGISCLGTTIRKAKTEAAMFRIDHDYTLAVAEAARQRGARRFIVVTSVGAGGRGFYLAMKGKIEQRISTLGFDRLDIVRPGLLLGPRAERRLAERLMQALAPAINPLLRGSLSKYAAIDASTVASAIVELTGDTSPGTHVHHNADLHRLAIHAI